MRRYIVVNLTTFPACFKTTPGYTKLGNPVRFPFYEFQTESQLQQSFMALATNKG